MTKVLVAGTFDFFHKGHEAFLTEASEYGDELHVIIARDESVKKIKNCTPTQNENTRKAQVESFSKVTKAYLGDLQDFMKIPKMIHPDVIALGYDQRAPELLKKTFPTTKIVRIGAFKPEQYKSSYFRKDTRSIK